MLTVLTTPPDRVMAWPSIRTRSPPATRTRPSGMKDAVSYATASRSPPVFVHAPVPGSYRSAYYGANERLIGNILRDLPVMPELAAGSAEYQDRLRGIWATVLEPWAKLPGGAG